MAGTLLFSSAALAWQPARPSPYVWDPADMPLEYVVAEECPLQSPDDCLDAVRNAFDLYEDASCSVLDFEYAGAYDGDAYGELRTFDLGDRRNHFIFDDPDDLLDVGVIAATVTQRFGLAFELFGEEYQWADNSDTATNNNIRLQSDAGIRAGICDDAWNVDALLAHDIGHRVGLGHSDDPDAFMQAIGTSPCEPFDGLREDDVEGVQWLYGARADIVCSHSDGRQTGYLGVVPFEVHCVLSSRDHLDRVTDAEWSFGDGTVVRGLEVSHTYTEPGDYTIHTTVFGDGGTGECGEWQREALSQGHVTACDLPKAVFSLQRVEPFRYEVLNDTEIEGTGCLQDIVWKVFEGTSDKPIQDLTVRSWEPTFVFDHSGDYTVVMNVGGVAGTSAATVPVRVRACGCSTAPTSGLGPLWLIGLFWIRRRRT